MWKVCVIAPPDPIHRRAKPCQPLCTAIEALRWQRHTGKRIAAEVEVSPATVSRVLRRLGLNRIRDLEPAEPERRYERESPQPSRSVAIDGLDISGTGGLCAVQRDLEEFAVDRIEDAGQHGVLTSDGERLGPFCFRIVSSPQECASILPPVARWGR